MESGLALADYLIVAGFFVVMLCIGAYYAGRMKSMRDFFGGGSRVPWAVSGVSLYMSTFSAFTFVAYSATAYKNGMVAITIWWLVAVCAVISAWFFAARWRRAASTSPLEFLETRYGPVLRQGFAWTGVPLIIIDDALKLFVIGKMVTVSMGITAPRALPLAIVACGAIMLTYTFLGGLWAVLVTDFVQFVVMTTAVIVLAPLVVGRVGGLGAFFTRMPKEMWAPTSGDYTWYWIIPFFFVMIFSYATRWSVVQRYYAVSSDRAARRVGYTVAVLTFVISPLIFMPAMAARIYMPPVADANDVYVLVCKDLLPVGMLGMVVAAMFSATMSMLSSDYNAVASVLTNDVYKRFFGPNASERTLVLAGRVATLVIGVIALGIALVIRSAAERQDLVQMMATLFGVLLPPMAIPMMFGLLTHRASNAGGLGAFLTGTACGLLAYALSYCEGLEDLRSTSWITWITSLPTLGVMGLLSLTAPDPADKRQRIGRFLAGLTGPESGERGEAVEPVSKVKVSDAVAAIRAIGLASAAMGLLLVATVLFTVPPGEGVLSLVVGIAMIALGATTRALAGRTLEVGVQPRMKDEG